MKKIFLCLLSIFTIINCSPIFVSYAINSVYVWSPSSNSTSTNNSITTNTNASTDLKLESGGAILIEQSTRSNII